MPTPWVRKTHLGMGNMGRPQLRLNRPAERGQPDRLDRARWTIYVGLDKRAVICTVFSRACRLGGDGGPAHCPRRNKMSAPAAAERDGMELSYTQNLEDYHL